MKTGKSLTELATEIERQHKTKRDFTAPIDKIELVSTPKGPMLALGEKPIEAGNVRMLSERPAFNVNAVAHGQLAEFVGIPKNYYDRMLASDPALLATNVNTWLPKAQDTSGARLIRTLDGNVRAFLSDRFRPLDNFELAEAVLPVLVGKNLKVVSCEITERRLYIKAFNSDVAAQIERAGAVGSNTFLKDVCSPVICISNSEVGYGSLSITSGIFTEGCTNLAFFKDSSMKKFHIGKGVGNIEDIQAVLTDKTKQLTDAAIWSQVRDIVNSAFDKTRFNTLVERVQATTTQKIGGNPVKVIELTTSEFGFTKSEGTSILKHLIEGGDLSRYGLFNAITRTAEDLDDYDRATEFERAGGKVIELPRTQWEKIAEAA